MLTLQHVLSCPKSDNDRSEDQVSTFIDRGVFALCDGASVSFDPSTWARILAMRFVRQPELSEDWLIAATQHYEALFNREKMEWMQQASYDRGSFSTILGIRLHEESWAVQIFAIGDSVAFLYDGDRFCACWPEYTRPEMFDARPNLVSSILSENRYLRASRNEHDLYADLSTRRTAKPQLFAASDALARWIVEREQAGTSAAPQIRELRSSMLFRKFVCAERTAGRLRRDDTTLMSFW